MLFWPDSPDKHIIPQSLCEPSFIGILMSFVKYQVNCAKRPCVSCTIYPVLFCQNVDVRSNDWNRKMSLKICRKPIEKPYTASYCVVNHPTLVVLQWYIEVRFLFATIDDSYWMSTNYILWHVLKENWADDKHVHIMYRYRVN